MKKSDSKQRLLATTSILEQPPNSYFTGSPFSGISAMTLISSAGFFPDPTLSRFIFYFCLRDRFSINSSTTEGSARVLVSPKVSSSLAATLRNIRRMIFPERVFGNPGAH